MKKKKKDKYEKMKQNVRNISKRLGKGKTENMQLNSVNSRKTSL